jgi:SAM-dependent methyltransferase
MERAVAPPIRPALLARGPTVCGMMATVSSIYEEPELYQLACAYRDVPAEAAALLTWLDKHATLAPEGVGGARSVLELAAGPAEHARELARRGLRSTALDYSPAMCAYAAGQAKAAGLELNVVEADMRDFRITDPDGGQTRFDLAITMLNSVCHLFTLDDLVSHLSALSAQLAVGGLYIVELAHPADFFSAAPRTSSEWTVDVGGVHAQVRWGGRHDQIDPITQITNEHMTIKATAADGTIRTVSDVVPNRFWTLTEFTAAVRLAGGYELAASYGDFDDTTSLESPTAWRMILILRRV